MRRSHRCGFEIFNGSDRGPFGRAYVYHAGRIRLDTAPMCATGQNIKDPPGNHDSHDAGR
jgi:hypothetical protein